MSQDCKQYRDLHDVLDGPADHPGIADAGAHVDACAACRAEVESARRFDAELRAHLNDVDLPSRLLEQAARIPDSAPVRGGRRRVALGAAAAGLALAVAAVIVVWVNAPGEQPSNEPDVIARLALADHAAHAAAAPAAGADVALRLLHDGAALRAEVERHDARLRADGFVRVACAPCPWGAARTAVSHLIYRRGAEVVSVFVVPATLSEGGIRAAANVALGAYHVALMPAGDTGYGVATVTARRGASA